MSRYIIERLRPEDVRIEVRVTPEDTPIEGNVMASGDELVDRRAEKHVRDQIRSGNEWAWCHVEVIAHWPKDSQVLSTGESLGCCSYESRESFEADAYYGDMVDSCCSSLTEMIQKMIDRATEK